MHTRTHAHTHTYAHIQKLTHTHTHTNVYTECHTSTANSSGLDCTHHQVPLPKLDLPFSLSSSIEHGTPHHTALLPCQGPLTTHTTKNRRGPPIVRQEKGHGNEEWSYTTTPASIQCSAEVQLRGYMCLQLNHLSVRLCVCSVLCVITDDGLAWVETFSQ